MALDFSGLFGSSWEDPKTMMMMQMAAGLLSGNPAGQNRATLGQSLSRGLLGGMQGYQQGLQMKRQGEKLDLEKREADLRDQQLQMQMDQQRQAMALQQQQRDAQNKFWGALGGQGLSATDALGRGAQQGSIGPTQANAVRMNQPWDGQITPQMAALWTQGGGKLDDLEKMAGMRNWGRSEVGNYFDMRNPNGSVTRAGTNKFGDVVNTGAVPFKEASVVDLGGSLSLRDPITNQLFPLSAKTMTPGETASNAVALGNLDVARGNLRLSQGRFGLEQQRFGADQAQRNQPIWSAEHGGFVTRPDASGRAGFMPVTGPDGKPLASNKPPTEFQRTSAGFAVRMRESGRVLEQLGASGNPSEWNAAAGSIPVLGNYLERVTSGADRQRAKQAEDDWIWAKLRRESGAAVPPAEAEAERRTYFPQPGDSLEVIAQKARARAVVEQTMIENAGAALGALSERVSQIPRARGATGSWSQQYDSESAAVKDARNALMRGAPKAEVIRRLEEMGIKNHGLK